MYKICSLIYIVVLGVFSGQVTATNSSLRDPTQPQSPKNTTTVKPNNELRIDAILSGKNRKMVIIENNLFTVGDRILNYTITSIDSYAIKLKSEHDEFEVAMPYSNIKSPTTINKKSRL